MSNQPLRGTARDRLIEELHQRYAKTPGLTQRFVYYRKKYSWMIVIGGAKALKRLLDIIISAASLMLLIPLLAIIALIIKVTDSGPILYLSNRVGKRGKEFIFPKFRTMVVGASDQQHQVESGAIFSDNVTFKMRRDPRTTWIGRILRRTSLDELPQLWCVLKGEMSLVGPRPALPQEVALYDLEQRKRLDAIPGLTCIWQVEGRSEIPFPHQVKLDLQYIESQNFWLDFLILLRTIPAVILGRGAY